MSILKPLYGAEAQAITITLDALANNGARQSALIDNTVPRYSEVFVQIGINVPAGTALTTAVCEVYAYGLIDYTSTPTFPDWVSGTGSDPLDGSDGAVVLPAFSNLPRIGQVRCATHASNALGYVSKLLPLSAAFGNIVPAKWGIVVVNKTGLTLASGCFATYQGINDEAV